MCEHLRRLGQRRDGTTSGAGPINPTLVLQNITTVIMGKRASSRRFKAFVTVFSQNCLGLKTGERFTEMIDVLTQRKAFAVGVQETWRSGVERFDQQGWRYLGVGPEQQHGRGTMGVGIFLSPAAVRAGSSGRRGCESPPHGCWPVSVATELRRAACSCSTPTRRPRRTRTRSGTTTTRLSMPRLRACTPATCSSGSPMATPASG